MKVALRRKYGSPSAIRLEEQERPVPSETKVLIQVHRTTVNRTDCANLTAKPFIMRFVLGLRKPRKVIIGTDLAGEVISVGKLVTRFSIGDRVMAFNDVGLESQAEQVCLEEENVYHIPQGVSYDSAAASMEGAHYAYSVLKKARIKSGQRVLINGTTGAIGSALLQFVRSYDVHITASSDNKNMDKIRALGADEVFDFVVEDFTKKEEKFDFIFDVVGKSRFKKCKHLLVEKGVYISSELGPNAENLFLALWTKMTKKKVLFPIPYPIAESLPYIINCLEKGSFDPLIDRTYDLDKITDAYEYVMRGNKTGNVLIAV